MRLNITKKRLRKEHAVSLSEFVEIVFVGILGLPTFQLLLRRVLLLFMFDIDTGIERTFEVRP